MASELHSVSIPEDLASFVEENGFKFSKIIQSAILKIMEDYRENPIIQNLKKKIAALETELAKYQNVEPL